MQEIFIKSFGTEHFKTMKTAGQLAKLNTAWSKPEKVAQWRAQAVTSQLATTQAK